MTDFKTLASRAAARYAAASITAKNFAYGKMTMDPVYERAMSDGLIPDAGAVLDIGCGQGLMLALLAEDGRKNALVGIETRPRMAYLARAALGAQAEILETDARAVSFPRCSAAILFDMLQMMSPAEQEALLARVIDALEPGGVILMREADAAAGWRYELVRISNQLKARLIGTWRWTRHYRSRHEWLECFARLGLSAEVCETASRNPLANLLFRAHKK